jgi:hypothetical protein
MMAASAPEPPSEPPSPWNAKLLDLALACDDFDVQLDASRLVITPSAIAS